MNVLCFNSLMMRRIRWSQIATTSKNFVSRIKIHMQLAELFGRDIKTIGKHINNALREELKDLLVVAKFATTKDYGRRSGFTQTREIDYYNLEMITSIGYRVKSRQGILFRQWANKVLNPL